MKIIQTDYRIDGESWTQLLALKCELTTEHLANPDELKVIGFVHLRHAGLKSAKFCDLWVHRDSRRQRVATALVEMSENIARQSDCETLGCVVSIENDGAADFYKAIGYQFAWEFTEDNDRIMVKQL
jgi:ribosomal protein S18 acetylase RimI-like enzyme